MEVIKDVSNSLEKNIAAEILSKCQMVQIPFDYVTEQCLEGGNVLYVNPVSGFGEDKVLPSTCSTSTLPLSNRSNNLNNIRIPTKLSPSSQKSSNRGPQLASSTPQRRHEKMKSVIQNKN